MAENRMGSAADTVPAAALPPLIAAMMRPEFYPDRPPAVDLRQSHISWIFLAGDYVYKVKKPVRFAFLDAIELEARRRLCFDEVRLNRRLAPSIYLGVVPIVASGAGFALAAEPAAIDLPHAGAVEYAVKMRRLPADRMLDKLIRGGAAGLEEICAIAGRLADFHRDAPVSSAECYGSASAVTRMVTDNLRECERFEGYSLSVSQMCGLARYACAFTGAHWDLLNRRARQGCVCEGHGDLRCEHICLVPPEIVIFDCVEFSERLRYGDTACEIAFLAMDLDRLGAQDLSAELAACYARLTNDHDFALMLPFYKCYRAAVRAKVESLKSLEPEVPPAERVNARELGRRYFTMACRYAGCYDGRPVAIVVCGPAGSGKSSFARVLARRLGCAVLSSDEIRKRLAGGAPTTSFKAPYGGGIYGKEFNRRTYDEMIARAQTLLASGAAVILDATFRHPDERDAVRAMAARTGVPVLFVECRAEEAEVLRRLSERALRPRAISDAGPEVYLRQRADFSPLDEIPPDCRIVADTTGATAAAVAAVEDRLALLCVDKPAAAAASAV